MAHISNFWFKTGISNKVDRHDCCGCAVCESACGKGSISMQRDQEGFLYPVVDENTCIDCGLCTKVCPVTNKCEDDAPYIKSYGGYSLDSRVIDSCASGGIATALSIDTIRKGGVVFGVRFNEAYDGAEYSVARTEIDLWNFCSSKYIQPTKSGIHKSVKDELQKGIPVLFVGCPCDVAALKRFLRKEYDNLLTCELFCAGTTSKKVLDGYRELREKKMGAKLVSFNVRDKEKGWFVQHIKEVYSNGKVSFKNHFGTFLGYGFLTFRRPSCYHCQYKQNTTYCDVKVGDFWGIKASDPFWNPKGVSVILAKNQKGVDALEALKDFKLWEIEHTKATINNAGYLGKIPDNALAKRDAFEKIFITENKGLKAACTATAPKSFWVKYYIPTGFHTSMKKVFHMLIDKK